MPIEYPYYIEPKLPIETLEDFLEEITGLFENIAGPWSPILFMEQHREQVAEFWFEVRKSLGSVMSQLSKINYESKYLLENAGLTGLQLDRKLDWLSDAWKRFRSKGTVKALKEVLKWINLLLGSLATVVPLVEPLKEFKESIELNIDAARENG